MKTPLVLWIPVVMLVVAVVWLLVYEIVSFTGIFPTISSLVRPNVKAHLVLSVFLLCIFIGFIAGLIYDWFISK